jgi:hypothetical protein
MEIRLSNHASEGMTDAGLTREDIVHIIEHAERTELGTTADEYEATLHGTLYHVVVVKDSNPPLIITVYEVRP